MKAIELNKVVQTKNELAKFYLECVDGRFRHCDVMEPNRMIAIFKSCRDDLTTVTGKMVDAAITELKKRL